MNIRSTPGRTSELTSCQVTLPAFCSITQNPVSPSGDRMPDLLERAQHVNFAGHLRRLGPQRGPAFDRDEVNDLGQVEMVKPVRSAGAGSS